MDYLSQFKIPRSNFDSIQNSFITVFQTLIGDRWNLVFYDCIRGYGYLGTSAYFITIIFIGHIVMMNLFLAMILGNFERASLKSSILKIRSRLQLLVPNTRSRGHSRF